MRDIVSYAFGAFSVVVILTLGHFINKDNVVEKPQVVQEVKPQIQEHTEVIYDYKSSTVQIFDVKSPAGKNCVVAVGF